jgi:dihydrodipicolinate synthase/N-acetylneuraminate lyase
MSFKGTFSVTITPTKHNGDVNIKSLQKYFNWQIKKKIGGLIILGSTGEFLSINKKNRLIMIKESVAITNKRIPLFVGTAAENTNDAIKLSVEAQKLGADGVMIHSKNRDPKEIFKFSNKFKKEFKNIPLVVVPSSFNQVKESQLIDNGFDIVIYANHMLRASYPAIDRKSVV